MENTGPGEEAQRVPSSQQNMTKHITRVKDRSLPARNTLPPTAASHIPAREGKVESTWKQSKPWDTGRDTCSSQACPTSQEGSLETGLEKKTLQDRPPLVVTAAATTSEKKKKRCLLTGPANVAGNTTRVGGCWPGKHKTQVSGVQSCVFTSSCPGPE